MRKGDISMKFDAEQHVSEPMFQSSHHAPIAIGPREVWIIEGRHGNVIGVHFFQRPMTVPPGGRLVRFVEDA